EGGGETFVKTNLNQYINNTDLWHLGRLTRAEVTSTAGGVSETRVSAFAYDPVTGLLTQEVIEPGTALALTTDYQYDPFGNKSAVTVSGPDILTRTAHTSYDAQGRFPVTATNALGHTETKVFDARFGTVTRLTGPNNLTTTWTYDGFGRKTHELRAEGTETSWSYDLCTTQCPAGALYAVTERSTGQAAVTVYYDQLNRKIRSETEGFDGTPIYADTEYNARGQVERTSRPYYTGERIYWTRFDYDLLGRVLTETTADGGVSASSYDGLTTTVTNALGKSTSQSENALGQHVRVVDPLSGVTTYAYDAFGNLIETRDAASNDVSMSYDLQGRKTAMHDPDMGRWSYTYNVLGELISQTDAKGQTVTMSYDPLGRMVSRTEPEGASTWDYDTAPAGIGKLHRATGPNGYLKAHSYDALGRLSETRTTVTMQTFAVANTYDTAGRVDTITYPTGFQVAHAYTATGYLMEVSDAKSGKIYWSADHRDAEGRVVEETFGNGLLTTREYNPHNGYLEGINTWQGNLDSVQNLSYVFDLAGNLRVREDRNQKLRERFTYDALNRLQDSTLVDTAIATTLSQKSYTYDALGNLTFKSDVGHYTYGEGQAGPHAVTAAGGQRYAYDANGNMTSGAGRSLNWTSFNKPRTITGATTTHTFLHG
ncbi:MAG: RHS repeat protein, partial [bacterium]|nr:RHS repeat protein [bacterium]